MTHTVWLLLGGNEGDVAATFDGALALLEERAGCIVSRSGRYSSSPWNMCSESVFLNMAVEMETVLPPLELLDVCKEIERVFGRTALPSASVSSVAVSVAVLATAPDSSTAYQSRPLDIDIIFYDDIIYSNPRLFIPHPLAHVRKFVLTPLNEICPNKIHPLYGKTVGEL
jgi:2-amino-4-hydroxy-6-hydroxymethyldihydropteridine diphosphokinase